MSAPRPQTPKFWRDETGGILAPAVEAYLNGQPMTFAQVAAMKVYLRQWIMAPVWIGTWLEELRRSVEQIQTQRDIDAWLDLAAEDGHDPL